MALELLQELFDNERTYLDHFFDHLDLTSVDQVLEVLYNCQGMIILSGIGKSGLVAEKIAGTLTSTGTRAFFLSPANALHGDIGIIEKKDILLFLSKSGESDELLHLVPIVRNKGAETVAIVSNPSSRLAKAVDLALCLPQERELCPFDTAPTTSTTMQSIVGDVLAISLMRMKNFSRDEYAKIHPAGQIGKRMTIKVRDLMLTNEAIPLCKTTDKLVDTLVELSNKQCGCVLIVDDKKTLLGIFTDGDLRRALQSRKEQALEGEMQDLMTANPRWIDPEELALDAVKTMEADQKHPIMVLPVLGEGKRVLGIIKMHDIVQSGI
ncbi:MAG: KpsF/GutQ family sugar-phosphate isomerase [Waddliaceae bacterium]